MRLEHWRKLYEQEARAEMREQEVEDLVDEILERWTIKDWKEYAAGLEKMKREMEEEGK